MKINAGFIETLLVCVANMGDGVVLTDFNLNLMTASGEKVNLSEIKQVAGLLRYQDQQVVLFIPDHSYKTVPVVQKNHLLGNKYHFAECSTLAEMRVSGRYEHRYHAHQNIEGKFEIFDPHTKAIVKLAPCQNCLRHVNYQGFNHANSQQRREIIDHLTLKVLFSIYSTLFKGLPHHSEHKAGYTANWKEISSAYRAKQRYTCELCGVNLSDHKHCLHTHHKDGNKQNNQEGNLQALCIDCHRKQHYHDHLLISKEEMDIIQRQRKMQGKLTTENWQTTFALVDEAWHGVLRYYLTQPEANAIPLPDLAFDLASIDLVDMAWQSVKIGFKLMVTEQEKTQAKAQGWQLISLNEAIARMSLPRSDVRSLPRLFECD